MNEKDFITNEKLKKAIKENDQTLETKEIIKLLKEDSATRPSILEAEKRVESIMNDKRYPEALNHLGKISLHGKKYKDDPVTERAFLSIFKESIDELIEKGNFKNLYSIEDIDKQIEQMKELKKDIIALERYYNYQPNSAGTQFMKNRSIKLNTKNDDFKVNKNVELKEHKNLATGQMEYQYTSNREDLNIIFDDLNKLKNRSHVNFRKSLDFILRKANEQNIQRYIYFDLTEYQKATGYKSKDTAYKGAIRYFEMLRGVSVGGTIIKGGKEVRNRASYIFPDRDISYNECFIECKPEIVKMLSQYFTLLPKWAGELNTKAYDLLDYIFYRARQSTQKIEKNNSFNINFKSINDYIGGYDPSTTRRHTEYIIDPLLEAVTEIEDTQRGEKLYITPIYEHDYKNAYDFLETGYLKIELGKEASKYFCDRNRDRKRKMKKAIK